MNYEEVELEIVRKLKESSDLNQIADTFVIPEHVAEYKTATDKALILVAFIGEQADSNQSVGQISQHATASFNISVQSMWLRGEKGIYHVTEKVKNILIGFSISDGGPLSLSEHVFSDYQNEVWEHSLTFSYRFLRAQKGFGNYVPGTQIINDEVYYQKNTVNEKF